MEFISKADVINYCEENSYNLKEGEKWHITSLDVDGLCYTEYELQDEANKNLASYLWFIFDGQGNIINENNGIKDREKAVEYFVEYFDGKLENDNDFTLCLLEIINGGWICMQELTASEVFELKQQQ